MKTVNCWRRRPHNYSFTNREFSPLDNLAFSRKEITCHYSQHGGYSAGFSEDKFFWCLFSIFFWELTGCNICVSSGGRYPSVTFASFLGNTARLFIGLTIDLEDGRHWEDLQFEGEREKTVKVRQPTKSNQVSRDDVKATKHSSFQLWLHIQAQGRRRLVGRRAEKNEVWARDPS